VSGDPLAAIPEEHRGAVRAALTAACGGTATVLPAAAGASGALVFRVLAPGRSLLLRIDARRDFFRDPARSYACMAAAADAGLAPALRYLDASAGVAVMDYVEPRPLSTYPGGAAELAAALGSFLGRLQATPPFPALVDYHLIVDGMLGRVERSTLFATGSLRAHRQHFERIRAAHAFGAAAQVSSHNDPSPRNFVYDGERLYLVDWETAFRNDPYADLAIVANDFARSLETETALLTAWRGRGPGPAERARLRVMRAVTELYYAGLILSQFAAQARGAPDDLAAPSRREFAEALSAGAMPASSPRTLYLLGKVKLAGFLAAAREPGFEEALQTAAGT
jgi:aminoglycoside phosphotransferase (APT) family kinase protein